MLSINSLLFHLCNFLLHYVGRLVDGDDDYVIAACNSLDLHLGQRELGAEWKSILCLKLTLT